jgi:multiple sugar transport system substrate-binding protein
VRSRIRRRRLSLQTALIVLLVIQLVCVMLWLQPGLFPGKVQLSMVVSEDEVEVWKALVNDFTAAHPNIAINLADDVDSTNDRENIYRDDFDAPDQVARHDLVLMDVVWIESFIDNLVDLSEYVKDDGLDLSVFLKSEVEIARRGESLYRMPMYPDVGLLYYRKDLLENAGLSLPSTLDSLENVVTTLKRSSAIESGYLWQGDAYEGLVVNFFEVMQGLGGQWIEGDDTVKLTDANTVAAARVFEALIQKQISPDTVKSFNEQKALDSFLEEKSAFLRGWPEFWQRIQASDLAGKVAIAPPFSFSTQPDSNQPGTGCRGGWGLGISKKSAHPKAAWEAIKYFTSEAAQQKFVLASGLLPSRTALFQEAEIMAKYPLMPQMLQYIERSSAFRPAIKAYGEVSEILQASLQSLLWEGRTAEKAMAEAQQKTQAFLASVER